MYIFSEKFPCVFPQEFPRLCLNPEEPRLLPALGAEQQLQGPSRAPGLNYGHKGFPLPEKCMAEGFFVL